jgi:hypothetical protein
MSDENSEPKAAPEPPPSKPPPKPAVPKEPGYETRSADGARKGFTRIADEFLDRLRKGES